MWGICDRCQQRVPSEATVVQLQHGELVRLTDGMPRMKATGAAQFHTLCQPCGHEVAQVIQQLMAPPQTETRTA